MSGSTRIRRIAYDSWKLKSTNLRIDEICSYIVEIFSSSSGVSWVASKYHGYLASMLADEATRRADIKEIEITQDGKIIVSNEDIHQAIQFDSISAYFISLSWNLNAFMVCFIIIFHSISAISLLIVVYPHGVIFSFQSSRLGEIRHSWACHACSFSSLLFWWPCDKQKWPLPSGNQFQYFYSCRWYYFVNIIYSVCLRQAMYNRPSATTAQFTLFRPAFRRIDQ